MDIYAFIAKQGRKKISALSMPFANKHTFFLFRRKVGGKPLSLKKIFSQ